MKKILAIILTVIMSTFALGGCGVIENEESPTRPVGFSAMSGDFWYGCVDAPTSNYPVYIDDFIAIRGLTEFGVGKEKIVVPEKIKDKPVILLGIKTKYFTETISENADYKKIYLPKTLLAVRHPAVDLDGRKIILYGDGKTIDEKNRKALFDSVSSAKDLKFYVDENLEVEYESLCEGKFRTDQILPANLTFMVDDSVYWIDDYENGEKIEFPQNPQKDGYEFKGWYKEKECLNEWKRTKDTYQKPSDLKSLKLYARFEKLPESYVEVWQNGIGNMKTVHFIFRHNDNSVRIRTRGDHGQLRTENNTPPMANEVIEWVWWEYGQNSNTRAENAFIELIFEKESKIIGYSVLSIQRESVSAYYAEVLTTEIKEEGNFSQTEVDEKIEMIKAENPHEKEVSESDFILTYNWSNEASYNNVVELVCINRNFTFICEVSHGAINTMDGVLTEDNKVAVFNKIATFQWGGNYVEAGTEVFFDIIVKEGENIVGYAVIKLLQNKYRSDEFFPKIIKSVILDEGAQPFSQIEIEQLIRQAKEK